MRAKNPYNPPLNPLLVTVDEEELGKARNDPRVIAFLKSAREYGERMRRGRDL